MPTAAADILAGCAIAGVFTQNGTPFHFDFNVVYLAIASIFLYAGGVVLNDVFDAEVDSIERPERPIPSGLITLKSAAVFGAALLAIGILVASYVHEISGLIALILALSIVLYDAISKKHGFLGPLNMGICRGLNLILGMSVLGEITNWWYAGIPLIYIFAITLISRGEVHGNNKNHIIWAGFLYTVVIVILAGILLFGTDTILTGAPFLALFAFLVFRPLVNAYRLNSPDNIKKAVMAGVLSLVVLDATLAVGFSVWWYGLLILMLLPMSLSLSKLFAVT